MFMNRFFSRITLEIAEVRVQRLQDISEEDARAEGATPHISAASGVDIPWWHGYQEFDGEMVHRQAMCHEPPEWMIDPRKMKALPHLNHDAKTDFRMLWNSINGVGSWGANPWVWALTFKRG